MRHLLSAALLVALGAFVLRIQADASEVVHFHARCSLTDSGDGSIIIAIEGTSLKDFAPKYISALDVDVSYYLVKDGSLEWHFLHEIRTRRSIRASPMVSYDDIKGKISEIKFTIGKEKLQPEQGLFQIGFVAQGRKGDAETEDVIFVGIMPPLMYKK